MARFKFCVLSAVICSFLVLGHGETLPEKSVKIPVSTAASVSPSSSEAVTKDDTVTSLQDTLEDTVTRKNKTTTTSTTSTTSTTTTTTTTTSTTTPPPTPAPTPAPLPPPEQGNWPYTENNVTCILVQFAAQLNVTYTKNDSALGYVRFNVPANASVVDGNCTGATQWLQISWQAKVINNSLVLTFHKNESTHEYSLKGLNVSLAPSVFPNASFTGPVEFYHGAEWPVPLSKSYRCDTPTQLNLTAESNGAATLTLSHLQEEAFRGADSKGFSSARECGGGDVPDAVPIAVGCALGGLVLVVLIAYLVGRRRSAARGYLSM